MSKLAEIYKQAQELVLKKYQEEPEDTWKVGAIARSRAGEKGHESTMFQFVKDIEAKVDELLKSIPIVASNSENNKSPNMKDVEVLPTVKPTQPH
jgi:uncharacterized protein (UPF0303 family)